MDIQPQTTKPISDDQELAKVLAGVTQNTNDIGFEETPAPNKMTEPTIIPTDTTSEIPVVGYNPPSSTSSNISIPIVSADQDSSSDLADIKKNTLIELRPLVDKLDISPEEKFEIYLLMLRSTDDKTLIVPAHAAAKNITDESKRAQALLDIIKEIDYLSNPPQTA
jgi:hypothetical protein